MASDELDGPLPREDITPASSTMSFCLYTRMCRGYVLSVRVKTKKCAGHKNVINMLDAFVNTYVHHLVSLSLLSSFISDSAFFLLSLLSFIDLVFFLSFFIPLFKCLRLLYDVDCKFETESTRFTIEFFFFSWKKSKTKREREKIEGIAHIDWRKEISIEAKKRERERDAENEMVVKENKTSSVLSLAVVALTKGTINDENRIRRPLFSIWERRRSRKLKTWEMPDQTTPRSTQSKWDCCVKENFLTMVYSSRNKEESFD